jgi:hypothetical protein
MYLKYHLSLCLLIFSCDVQLLPFFFLCVRLSGGGKMGTTFLLMAAMHLDMIFPARLSSVHEETVTNQGAFSVFL